ncbi:hypothetical protein Lser_V15G23758 [Lactuca serriola]
MNIGKVSKVEYPRRKVLDSSSNSKASTSKNNIITPKESKVNEVKPRSIKSKKAVIKSGVKTSSLKDTSRDNNQKSKVHKNQITKLPPPYNNTRQKVVSKDPQVATRNKETKLIPKPNALEDSRRTHVSKVSSQVVKEKRSSPTRYESQSYIPIHHIRWEGLDNEVCGHKCNFCNKDLSCSPDKDDDDYGYDEYDRYSNDENKYQILLPAVDILACGHAFHTECGSYLIPNEQSTDPQCVLCFSMASF